MSEYILVFVVLWHKGHSIHFGLSTAVPGFIFNPNLYIVASCSSDPALRRLRYQEAHIVQLITIEEIIESNQYYFGVLMLQSLSLSQ